MASPRASTHYASIVAYDGTNYHGFQVQPDQDTIQGSLEAALAQITGSAVRVTGAGRTDAGVHAQGQVVDFWVRWRHSQAELQRALNAVVPRDISVRRMHSVSDRFHARFSAQSRIYRYVVYVGSVRMPIWDRFALYVPETVQWEEMNRAAALLSGHKDFAAFGQPTSGDNTVRRIHEAAWQCMGNGIAGATTEWTRAYFQIEANGFLRGMVRRIVAALLSVGKGKLVVREFQGILESRDISRIPGKAAAHGLTLWHVRYPK